MKLVAGVLPFLVWVGTAPVRAQISSFQHIILMVQENRTPDNMFQGLCTPPYGLASNCKTSPTSVSKYNILTANWLDKSSPTGTTQPGAVSLIGPYDLDHSHLAFQRMYDGGLMDGAASVLCFGTCPPSPQFMFVDNSTGILNPYLEMATQYGWANYMFQTNQGPSFPAHQFLFGGTSAVSAADDATATFAAENSGPGCLSLAASTVAIIDPDNNNTEEPGPYPCFEHLTMGDLLDNLAVPLSWKYYSFAPANIWTAPNAIQHICQSSGPDGYCTGPIWNQHVSIPSNTVLKDITACNLPNVSWVIPRGQNSDHAKDNDGGGPSWVASIVNAVGTNPKCANGEVYWQNTAILITWDDWGGWYDHEAPTILSGIQGDYQYGFRVPLIVISAYTPAGYTSNRRQDFGSLLNFIEYNFKLPSLGFADARSSTNLIRFFNLGQAPRPFTKIAAPLDANYFLNDTRPPLPPDTD